MCICTCVFGVVDVPFRGCSPHRGLCALEGATRTSRPPWGATTVGHATDSPPRKAGMARQAPGEFGRAVRTRTQCVLMRAELAEQVHRRVERLRAGKGKGGHAQVGRRMAIPRRRGLRRKGSAARLPAEVHPRMAKRARLAMVTAGGPVWGEGAGGTPEGTRTFSHKPPAAGKNIRDCEEGTGYTASEGTKHALAPTSPAVGKA